MSIADIESVIGRPLPSSYKDFLSTIKDYCYIVYNEYKDRFPESEGAEWFVWGERRLRLKIHFDGAKSRPAWQILQSFVEIGKCKTGDLGILAQAFVMAEDNGDYLFMDTSNAFAVYRFMHDSGEVREVAPTFDKWLSLAKLDESDSQA